MEERIPHTFGRVCYILLRYSRRLFAAVVLVAAPFIALTVAHPNAHAESGCSSGISATYQLANTIVEHAGKRAGREIRSELREYVPDARPINVSWPEHVFQLNYDHLLRDHARLRLYGGFSIWPDQLVDRQSGSAYYEDGSTNGPVFIGEAEAHLRTAGRLFITGADLLLQTGGCHRERLHLVGGAGLAFTAYEGTMRASFDALITKESPDLSMRGSYSGFGVHTNLMGGVRIDLSRRADVLLLGGYRLGVGYVSFRSEIKDKDGVMPIAGPFFQVTLGYRF